MTSATVAPEPGGPASVETHGPDATGEELEQDQLFDILRNQRRRTVLRYLAAHSQRDVALGDLAEVVAARELDKPRAALTSAERKRVYIGLYQVHLPRMDDVGAVEFEEDRKRIRLGPNAPALSRVLTHSEAVLDDGAPDERPQTLERYPFGVAVCGLALFVLSALAGATVESTALVVTATTIVAAGALSTARLVDRL